MQEPESDIDRKTYDVCLSVVAHTLDEEHSHQGNHYNAKTNIGVDHRDNHNNNSTKRPIAFVRTITPDWRATCWHAAWTSLGLFSPGWTDTCWSTHNDNNDNSTTTSVAPAAGWSLGFFAPGVGDSVDWWSSLNGSSSLSTATGWGVVGESRRPRSRLTKWVSFKR